MRVVPVIIICLVGFFASGQSELRRLKSLSMEDIRGEQVRLSSVIESGKPIIISFWATWCRPCIQELGAFSRKYDQWKKNYDIEIYVISLDEGRAAGRAKTFVETRNWPFVALFDPELQSMAVMGFENIPYTLLLDRNGDISYSHNSYLPGDEEKMESAIMELE